MGYISQAEGTVSITDRKNRANRPDADEVFEKLKSKFDKDNELHWVIDVVDTANGYDLIYSEAGKAYTIAEDIQMIIDHFLKDGYDASGEVRLIGEESPDFSRVIIRKNKAILEKAKIEITFPDGTSW